MGFLRVFPGGSSARDRGVNGSDSGAAFPDNTIAQLFVNELVRRLAARKIAVLVDDAVLDKLAADGFDPVYGARPLRREVERQLENPLAMKIVSGQCPDGSRVRVQVRDGEIAFEIAGG